MKFHLPLSLRRAVFGCLLGTCFATVSSANTDGKNMDHIAFVGDSITNYNCWRYSIWQNLMDNSYSYNSSDPKGEKEFKFAGSMTQSQSSSSGANRPATPNYMGQAFVNVHEGHNAWTTSDLVGATSNKNGIGNGYLQNWLMDGHGTRLDSNMPNGNPYAPTPGVHQSGQAYRPDTVVLMAGVNDYTNTSGGATAQSTVDHLGGMVSMLRASNPNVTIYIGTLSPRSGYPGDAGKDQAAIDAHIKEVNAELLKIGAT